MKNIFAWVFIGIIMGTLPAGAILAQDAAPRPALTVMATSVAPTRLTPTIGATGNVRAWNDASISAQTTGLRLKSLHADVGDRVKKGQLLAQFEDTASQGDLEQARARLRQAQATLENARKQADRLRKLRNTGAISISEVDQALASEKSAIADQASAEAALNTQVQRSSYTRLLAPSDGVISVRNAVIGAVVNPGQEIFHLVVHERLEWQARLSMRKLALVAEGMPVSVDLPGGRQTGGRVRQIAPTLDEETRQGMVYVDLEPDSQLRAGMFLRGRFELPEKRSLTVPRPALVLRDGFYFVFVVKSANKVAQTKVQIGNAKDDTLEITAGLREGDRVVTSGAAFLNDGDVVRVVTEPGDGGAAPAAEHDNDS